MHGQHHGWYHSVCCTTSHDNTTRHHHGTNDGYRRRRECENPCGTNWSFVFFVGSLVPSRLWRGPGLVSDYGGDDLMDPCLVSALDYHSSSGYIQGQISLNHHQEASLGWYPMMTSDPCDCRFVDEFVQSHSCICILGLDWKWFGITCWIATRMHRRKYSLLLFKIGELVDKILQSSYHGGDGSFWGSYAYLCISQPTDCQGDRNCLVSLDPKCSVREKSYLIYCFILWFEPFANVQCSGSVANVKVGVVIDVQESPSFSSSSLFNRRRQHNNTKVSPTVDLSLIHIWRCRRSHKCRSRWSPYH